MNKGKTKFLLFGIGGLTYGIIEILWRGHTHPSMISAGGICFVIFSKIGEKMRNTTLFFKAIVGSFIITSIELVFGVIFNIILKKNVWDYSKMPLNFLGQICALYSFFWFVLSLIGIPFAIFCKRQLKKLN